MLFLPMFVNQIGQTFISVIAGLYCMYLSEDLVRIRKISAVERYHGLPVNKSLDAGEPLRTFCIGASKVLPKKTGDSFHRLLQDGFMSADRKLCVNGRRTHLTLFSLNFWQYFL